MEFESKHNSVNDNVEKSVSSRGGVFLTDNRSASKSTSANKENSRSKNNSVIQQSKQNNTGLPNNLKSGVESLSGISMNDVKVHYNSSKPAQLNAHAYAQGNAIHLATGQEKHLPHEAWHIVQQKQGRVKPTMQTKENVSINDDEGLEKEADVMGAKALQLKIVSSAKKLPVSSISSFIIQGNWITSGLSSIAGAAVGGVGALTGAVVGGSRGLYNNGLSGAVAGVSRGAQVGWTHPGYAAGEFAKDALSVGGAAVRGTIATAGVLAGAAGATAGAVSGVVRSIAKGKKRGDIIEEALKAGGHGYYHPAEAGIGLAGDALRVTAAAGGAAVGLVKGAVTGGVKGAIKGKKRKKAVRGALKGAFYGGLQGMKEGAKENFEEPGLLASAVAGATGASAATYLAGASLLTGPGALVAASGALLGGAAAYGTKKTVVPVDYLFPNNPEMEQDPAQIPLDAALVISGAIRNSNRAFSGNVIIGGQNIRVKASAEKVGIICARSPVREKLVENPALLGRYNLQSIHDLINHRSVQTANEVSGLLRHKHAGLARATAVIDALNNYVLNGTAPRDALRHNFSNAPMPSTRDLEINRFIMTVYEQLYPAAADLAGRKQTVTNQWRAIEAQEPLKVVSHRGDGATFDKVGDYNLPRHVHNTQYVHEDENSEASVRKTMRAIREQQTPLSGIECDVHLTADGVPIVIHTVHLTRLMKQEGRLAPTSPDADIQNTLAAAVDPRNMPLRKWLNIIGKYIDHKVRNNTKRTARGLPADSRKVRLEIEMKHGGQMDNPHDMRGWQATNKIVSEFLKKAMNSHMIEIAMFNNSDAPRQAHIAAQSHAMLSHVIYGKGGAPDAMLNEVRFGMHQKGLRAHIDSGALDNKIVTFAPGLDFPHAHGDNRQIHPVASLPTALDITIEQSIQSARHRHLNYLINQRRINTGSGPVSVHTLTDHGAVGARRIFAEGGLSVGGTGLVPHWYNAAPIIAKHNMLTRDAIVEAVNFANARGDSRWIGERLIQQFPGLL